MQLIEPRAPERENRACSIEEFFRGELEPNTIKQKNQRGKIFYRLSQHEIVVRRNQSEPKPKRVYESRSSLGSILAALIFAYDNHKGSRCSFPCQSAPNPSLSALLSRE
jgi:hypothetical protein